MKNHQCLCGETQSREIIERIHIPALSFGWTFHPRANPVWPVCFGFWASTGISGAASGSIRAAVSTRSASIPPTRAPSIAPIFPPTFNPPDAMKRTKRRLPIPQWEFGFTLATFNLMFETGLDGERITRERAEADRALCDAEAAQSPLLTATPPTLNS
jgi:hypothetical protein